MSFIDGMKALKMEMPDRIPRTEYSVEGHPEVVSRVSGIHVTADSNEEIWFKARKKFFKAWNYGLRWHVTVGASYLKNFRTDMGHAVYGAGSQAYRIQREKIFEDEDDVYNFDPAEALGFWEEDKLVAHFNEDYRLNCSRCDDAVVTIGTYISLMSGLIELYGWDLLLLAAGTDIDAFGAMTDRYADWMMQYMNALAKCDAPAIMIHDDFVWTEGGFMPPAWYRKYLFENYRRYTEPLLKAGKRILFTADGNYTEYFDDLVNCGFHTFVMEPTSDMELFASRYGKTHGFVGNADTRILLMGSKEDIEKEVSRCMNIGRDCPGFIMAVGNHIPANTPTENVLWYNEFYEKMSWR